MTGIINLICAEYFFGDDVSSGGISILSRPSRVSGNDEGNPLKMNSETRDINRKTLVLRLSSLGDVVLASAALETFPKGGVDWVVAREFSLPLQGHPKIGTLHVFDRREGLTGWLKLARKLWLNNYSEVIDLHRSVRTRILRALFLVWGLGRVRWTSVPKRRLRYLGFYLFKRAWPAGLRPKPKVGEFARTAGGTGAERPDLRHLTNLGGPSEVAAFEAENEWLTRPFVCVMPGAQWEGKRWPIEEYVALARRVPFLQVVLGTEKDRESLALVEAYKREGIEHRSGVGRWDLRQVALVLSRARGYVGNDTGLAHLAEAVGTVALVVFGPTVPEMGFGPWRQGSASAGSSLWCRPCGKDGRNCFRVSRRYHCLKSFPASEVRLPESWKS